MKFKVAPECEVTKKICRKLSIATQLKSTSDTEKNTQSQKNPVSMSAMLTGKFLQIRKVFATSSLLAEEFPDTLQYKISR